MRSLFLAAGILVSSALVSGCAAKAPPASAMPVREEGYALGSGDRLRITVYGEDKLTGEYLVDGTGSIAFPLIGAIRARGSTITQLSEKIAAALRQGFLDDPSISIEVLNFRPFYILGEVNHAGEFPYVEGLTVYSAVAKAEGFTYRAETKRVFIRHKDAPAEVLYRLDGATPVQPGDTIRIPERSF
ncbi:polysaccharide biosynthesis/export family protein [Novosphingobium colocasiae]|nr:polysaccharide biosynthesis/export family protein [Novosphingobium colocasiae]